VKSDLARQMADNLAKMAQVVSRQTNHASRFYLQVGIQALATTSLRLSNYV
jgi:hypothetical protein